jgi:hypothetical protein
MDYSPNKVSGNGTKGKGVEGKGGKSNEFEQCSMGSVTQSECISFPPTCHGHQLPVSREDDMADGGGQLRECLCWLGGLGHFATTPTAAATAAAPPESPVVDVDDAAGASDGYPSTASQVCSSAVSSQGNDCGADGSFVVPSGNDFSFSHVPLDDFTSFASCRETFAVMPPLEIGQTSSTLHVHLCDPL